MIEWYTKDPWKAYISWFSPRWAMPRDQFDAVEWVDKLVRGGFRVAVMHTKHHDGVCFFPSAHRRGQPERDFIGELVAEAHRREMKIVAYYSPTVDAWSCQEHPEWCCRERDGSPIEIDWAPYPGLGVGCVNNPGYRALILGQLEELQQRYAPDGFWMDIFYFQPQGCFCHHCRTQYAAAHDGRDLEAMHGSAEVALWQRDSFRTLLTEVKRIATRDGTERVVVFNQAGVLPRLGYGAVDALCTTLSTEAHSPAEKSFSARVLAHKDQPYELYSPVSDTVNSWTVRPTSLITLEASIVAAHGGTLLGGFDVTPSGCFSGYQMEQLGRVAAHLRTRQEYLVDTRPEYDVGLFGERTGNWSLTLLRYQVPYGVLLADVESLAGFRSVVIEDGYPLDERLLGLLERYVEDGGNLLVERSPALAGASKAARLERLLGVERRGETGFDANYLARIDQSIAANLGADPVRADGRAWNLELTTARALACYQYPIAQVSQERWLWHGPNPPRAEASDDPAVTVNRYGAGTVIYLGCSVGSGEHLHRRQLVQLSRNLLAHLEPEPLVRSETPPEVEVVVNRQGERHVVHLLNHYGDMTQMFDRRYDVPRLARVTVWLNERRIGPVSRIVRVPQDRELAIERDANWVRLVADELAIQEIFVIEH